MFDEERGRPSRWAVVLSGGEGERMRPFITRWLGSHRPKQYCAFTGERTMIEEALRRGLSVAGSERMVTIIGKGHWRYMDEPRRLEAPGRIIEQPANRGTTAGVLLPLAFVLKQDPEAVAVLLPSDHFIAQPFRFQRHLRRALRRAEEEPGRIFLLAARPDAPEPDYGWLRLRPNASGVDEFLEKPDRETALRLYAEGCLWNTMVVAAKASTLWDLGRRHCPGIVSLLESARAWLGSPWESEALREVYSKMPESNFSKAILERVPERIGAVVMNDVGWSDWGRPERIIETLEGLRLEANFPKPGRLSPQFA